MKKIIFDLDGTLYDDNEVRKIREEAILKKVGDNLEKYKEYKKIHSTTKSLELIGISRSEFYELLINTKITLQKDEKLISLLKNLKNEYELIILSNSPKECVLDILTQLEITEFFSRIFSGNDFQNPKPSIEAFQIVSKGDICIGNTFKKDLMIPKEIGAITILVSEENNNYPADYIIQKIHDLLEIIEKIKSNPQQNLK